MASTVHRTCTLSEATCGLTFQADGDRILSVRPDPHDPISKGYVCPKGIAIAGVHDDPDRLSQPLRRIARGSFAPIAWKEALDEAVVEGVVGQSVLNGVPVQVHAQARSDR